MFGLPFQFGCAFCNLYTTSAWSGGERRIAVHNGCQELAAVDEGFAPDLSCFTFNLHVAVP